MSPPVRYDDAMLETVESMWRAGDTLTVIAATVGRSKTWISHTANARGWPKRGYGWRGMIQARNRAAAFVPDAQPMLTVRCPDCLACYETPEPSISTHAGCTRITRIIDVSEFAMFAVADPNIYPEITE